MPFLTDKMRLTNRVAPWMPPEETRLGENISWAPLYTLDLSQIHEESSSPVSEQIVQEVGSAFSDAGFIYVENHGLDYQDVLRQYSVAQHLFDRVSDKDKQTYTAKITETGSFCGYKQIGHWKINDVSDRIEQWNFRSSSYGEGEAQKRYPPAIHPFLSEIRSFARFNHNVIVRKILTVLSLVLKVEPDYLWNLSRNYEVDGDDFLRYMLIHRPPKEDDQKTKGVRIQGHTDFGSVSILWSQPIASLQVLGRDNVWRTVRHKPNALIVNLGDALYFLSGGYLRATIHRVVAPPDDQLHYRRLNVLYFSKFDNDVNLTPIKESPIARKADEFNQLWHEQIHSGQAIPTSQEWNALRVSRYGQNHAKLGNDGHHHETIAGHKVTLYNDTATKSTRTEIAA